MFLPGFASELRPSKAKKGDFFFFISTMLLLTCMPRMTLQVPDSTAKYHRFPNTGAVLWSFFPQSKMVPDLPGTAC